MSLVTLKAHFDGEHIILDEPCNLPVDTPVIVTAVSPLPEVESERAQWAALGARNLARAYGDDEPEYTLADLKSSG